MTTNFSDPSEFEHGPNNNQNNNNNNNQHNAFFLKNNLKLKAKL